MGQEAAKYVKKYGLNTIHDACVVEQVGQELRLVLMEDGESDWSSSLNAFVLSEGLACLDKRQVDDAPEDISSFYEF
jgi:hypothetical protein